MRRNTPLHGHPNFTVLEHSAWTEYRVEAASSRRRTASAFPTNLWRDACLVLILAYFSRMMTFSTPRITALAIVALVYLHSRFTQVQWESVVIFPSLGLQLETHRGIAGISLLAARKFIPWSSLEDFLINEGLRGWNVRYYLVAINRSTQGALQLEVAFENILPRFPVLLEVYRSVQEALQNESEHRSDT